MAYTAWSVVAGEQPTAAKWNLLGTNDASFNDGTGIAAGAIGTTPIASSAVTTAKMKPTTINSGFSVQGVRFSTSSTTYVDVTGMSFTYTSGSTAERLFLFMEVMGCGSTGNNGAATLSINSVDQTLATYHDGTAFTRQMRLYTSDIPASTTWTIKIRYKSGNGAAVSVTNDGSNFMPIVTGFAISNA